MLRNLLVASTVVLGGCIGARVGPPARIDIRLPDDVASLTRLAKHATGSDADRKRFLTSLAAARKLLKLNPKHDGAAWMASRACFLLGEIAANNSGQARWANEGIGHARRAIRLAPRGVAGHYYLALNLGILARADRLSALGLLPKIQAAAKRAMQLDADFDRAGVLRLLGALYTRAPPWPNSIGDREEGLRLLKLAVKRSPDTPLNRLFLAEALVADERFDAAKQELKKVLMAPPSGEWAREGKRYRKDARKLLRLIAVKKHHGDD